VDVIAPGIRRWTAPHPEWQPDVEWAREVASFALAVDETLVLVDPLVPDDLWPRVDELAAERSTVAALITIPFHLRNGEDVLARYGAKASLWGHPAVAKKMRDGSALRLIEPGAPLPGGAEAYAIGRRQEMPLWFPSHRALAFGDAVVGVDGALRIWEDADSEKRMAWYRTRLVPRLEPLLALDAATVLVTHGPPVVGGGRAALREALAADPWDYH
jgi:hypothetical protein